MNHFGNQNPINAFLDALHQCLGSAPQDIEPDKIIRFDDKEGKPGNKACWAILFLGDIPSGAYGNWRTGIQDTWCAKSHKHISQEDREKLAAKISDLKKQRNFEIMDRQEKAAQKAKWIWDNSVEASPSHPYFIRKKIANFCARQRGHALVLPIIDINKQLSSLQFIGPYGEKRLLAGGKKSGNFIPIQSPTNHSRALICEGFATAATLAEFEPFAFVVAAIDAGNLESVAVNIRSILPHSEIVICADADPIGIDKARKAAMRANAYMAVPEFPPGTKGTDFNDLISLAGEK